MPLQEKEIFPGCFHLFGQAGSSAAQSSLQAGAGRRAGRENKVKSAKYEELALSCHKPAQGFLPSVALQLALGKAWPALPQGLWWLI